jgi:molybdopterin-binding protein
MRVEAGGQRGISTSSAMRTARGDSRRVVSDRGDTLLEDPREGSDMALLTVRAAAEQLGVAYSTVKRWVHSGRVRTTRTEGGHHRVSDAEIDRLLARQQPDGRRAPSAADEEVLTGLSARNRLRGFVDEVRIDGLLAQVRLRLGDQSLTAVITADAVRALKLRRGDDALAIIKSTEVMIARSRGGGSQQRTPVRRRR